MSENRLFSLAHGNIEFLGRPPSQSPRLQSRSRRDRGDTPRPGFKVARYLCFSKSLGAQGASLRAFSGTCRALFAGGKAGRPACSGLSTRAVRRRPALIQIHPENIWRFLRTKAAHVTGHIDVHGIDCRRHEMTHPGPITARDACCRNT